MVIFMRQLLKAASQEVKDFRQWIRGSVIDVQNPRRLYSRSGQSEVRLTFRSHKDRKKTLFLFTNGLSAVLPSLDIVPSTGLKACYQRMR